MTASLEPSPDRQASPLARVIGTWFGCGYAPFAPGTFGSLGALVVAPVWIRSGWHPLLLLALTLVFLVPAVWAAEHVARAAGRKDPGMVVVDEVLGTWVALAGALTLNWKTTLAAFALFRLFDIWKPWPARQLEHLPGGAGIVADDLMAGVYAALVLFAAGCFNFY